MSGKKVTLEPPFGAIEQRELRWLIDIGIRPTDIYVLIVLRSCSDGTSPINYGISALVRWTGMGASAVKAALKRLDAAKVIRRQKHPVHGGSRGLAWSWTTTLLPLAIPREEQPKSVPSSEGRGVEKGGKRSRNHVEEESDRRGAIQSVLPDVLPERERTLEKDEDDARGAKHERPPQTVPGVTGGDASREGDGGGPDHRTRLIRRWKSSRLQIGLEKFTDRSALTWLGEAIDRAVAAGCTAADLDAAFKSHVDTDFADPREFDEWAERSRARRADLEAAQRSSRAYFDQLDREQQERDEQLRTERADPEWAANRAVMKASFQRAGIKTIGGVIELLANDKAAVAASS